MEDSCIVIVEALDPPTASQRSPDESATANIGSCGKGRGITPGIVQCGTTQPSGPLSVYRDVVRVSAQAVAG